MRDAVHQQLSLSERGLEHARAAAVMAEQGASAEQVAAQLLMTARRGEAWVVERLRAAAAAAVAEGAADAAVSYLRRALEEPPPAEQRPQLLLELGMAEALTSGPEAVAHLREALTALDDDAVHAAAAPVLAQSLIFTGAPREAAAYAREAAAGQERRRARGDRGDRDSARRCSASPSRRWSRGCARIGSARSAPARGRRCSPR